jgi:hypothetical protein
MIILFAAAIGYLKDHLVGEIKHRNLGAVEDMMYWVVSIFNLPYSPVMIYVEF